jgi:hypothetical protein
MRRFLFILIAISLSSVTTSYACGMSGVVAVACCCEGASEHAPVGSPGCSTEMMPDVRSDGCCSIVTAASFATQGQAESLTAPDLPVFGRSAVFTIARPPPSTLGVAPHQLARTADSPPLYLLIGRLLR